VRFPDGCAAGLEGTPLACLPIDMTHPRPAVLLAALLTTAAGTAQDRISLLEGAPGTATLRELDESDPTGAGRIVRRDLEVVPLEITNRTAQQALCGHCPRLLVRAGTPRVELPGGGRVLRYRLRGGEQWGFLLITARGEAIVLLELPGVGALRSDPFTDRFGVATDGRHAAITTALGGLYAVRLDGGVYASTQSPARPIALAALVEHLAVAPGPTHVFFVTDDNRIWRCPLVDGGAPQDMTPPAAAGSILKDELAPAGDGRSVAFLFGPRSAQHLWLLREQGNAVQLPPPPSDYEEPGYLPEIANGPRMLLNDDGSRLFYIESAVREELFLLDTSGATATAHVTSDANFDPYIGVGILPVFANQTLLLAVGDPNAFDWYVAATGVSGVTNITRTADRSAPPFGPGKLDPLTAGTVGGGVLLASERQPDGTWALRRLDGARGTTALLAQGLRALPVRGDALDTPPNLLVPSVAGDRLTDAAGAPLLVSIPGLALSTDTVGSGGAFSVLEVSLGAISLPLALVSGGPLLPLGTETNVSQLVLTRGGGLLLNGGALRYYAPGIVATIAAGSPRIVLSGAGA
jgi:hypothetical protein